MLGVLDYLRCISVDVVSLGRPRDFPLHAETCPVVIRQCGVSLVKLVMWLKGWALGFPPTSSSAGVNMILAMYYVTLLFQLCLL